MFQYKKKFSKEEVNRLPLNSFQGNIILLENIENAKKVIHYLKEQKVLGFDTETKPAFRKGQRYNVALLQLATNKEAFLFRLNNYNTIDVIVDILSDKNIIKVGVAVRDDIKGIQKRCKFIPEGFIELQKLVKKFGIEDTGLRKLTANILGFRISKVEQISNWEKIKLTKSQMKYAATDAWVGYKIYNKLMKNG